MKKIGLAAAFCLPIVAAAFASGLASTAHAGAVIDRIRTGGVIRCGGVSRPGLVGQSPDGRIAAGLYLDLCRAIGAALLGPEGRIEFRPYDSDKAFDRVRDGTDDLSFLDGSEILGQGLAGRTTLGPPVVFVSTAAMVPGDSAVRSLADLAGKTICFYQGSNAHRNLEAWMAAHRLDFRRMGLMEYGELYDTYNARVCDAQVGEIGDLAVARLDDAGAGLKSRILAEPLATFPILAVTPCERPAMVGDRRLGGLCAPARRASSEAMGGGRSRFACLQREGPRTRLTTGEPMSSAPREPMPTSTPAISATARG